MDNPNAQPYFASPSHNYPIYADHHLNPNLFHHQQYPTPVVEDPRVRIRRLRKRKAGAGGVMIPFPTGPVQQDNKSSATPTTIMIKNIPNQFSAVGARRFYQHYHNFEWDVQHNRNTCEITSARVQGKKALIRNFRRKVFWCEYDEYLPVVVAPPCDGVSPPKLINCCWEAQGCTQPVD